MLEQLQSWWQNVTPETLALLQDGGLAFVALAAGWIVGSMAARVLRGRNFDATLRLPGSAYADPDRAITPTWIVGILVRLTAWAAVGWWLANKHGRTDLAHTLGLAISRTWSLVAVFVAALSLGSLMAQRLSECLGSGPRSDADPTPFRNGAAARSGMAGPLSAVVYILSVLLVLLLAADLFDWPLTRNSALALWQFAQHLLVAGAALFIGGIGARWAREQMAVDASESPEKQAGQYTALGIMAASTVLALAVLLSSAGVLLGLAALALFGGAAWLLRGYLPDVAAGLQLRAYRVKEVCFEGAEWQVSDIGFLTTQVCRAGELYRVPNRAVLEARMNGAPEEATAR
jgi:hypothetical protein